MKKDYVFLFDLDSTITKAEILPTVANQINKKEEMQEITEKTMMGELLFEESLNARVKMLSEIPINTVANIVEKIEVSEKLVKFLKENKDKCYIVTSNLDVWISKLMKKIGMENNFFCTKTSIENDKFIKLKEILSKDSIVEKFKAMNKTVVAVGDGSNDKMMLEKADIGIAYGGVREVAPVLFNVSNYAVYDEIRLYNFLNKINNSEPNDDTTVVISCAGMGKRLGLGIPKALVDVDNKSLIIRNLEMLDSCKDVRIVVGYKSDLVIKSVLNYRKDILFVFNNDYMNNGTGASVSLAARFANKYLLTIDGDLLIHPIDMIKILEEKEEFVGVCKPTTDNPVLVSLDENSNIIEFSRDYGVFEWNGVSLIKTDKLRYGEGHVYQLIENLLPLKYKLLNTKEIDTMNDFKNAERWVRNNFSDNLTIGIIGGMGSYATVNFFERMIDAFPAEKEWDRPRIIIDNHCNMPSRVRALIYNERKKELVKSLCESVKMMLNNNVDYIVLNCDTAHVFLDEILLNVPEAEEKIINNIKNLAQEVNLKNVKLYASEGTLESNIYEKIFSKYKIQIEIPSKSDIQIIRNWVEAVKSKKITEDVKNEFIKKINNEKIPVILGCTELPILYEKCKNSINVSVFDPLQSTIEYLVEKQKEKVN